MISTVSKPALDIINNYLHLPLGDTVVSCPYYNNKRQKVRGALRVLVGKGSPEDIAEEAAIMAMREKIHLASLTPEQLKQFLVDHNLGIDCSALAYYILDADVYARTGKRLGDVLHFPSTSNPLRLLLRMLRKVENTDVTVLADNRNSAIIPLAEACAGDMITFLETGLDFARNHIILIHAVETKEQAQTVLHYTHSLQWSTDGKYNHGVRQGQIILTNQNKPLTEQLWEEQGKIGQENETYRRALQARRLELRRLLCLRT